MLTHIHPKLPMRNKDITKDYYINKLGFEKVGTEVYDEYLMIKKDDIEIHFFLFKGLNTKKNYGQIYIRTNTIDQFYQELLDKNITIHPNGKLGLRPWGQKEFALLDPDSNLLTFGQNVN